MLTTTFLIVLFILIVIFFIVRFFIKNILFILRLSLFLIVISIIINIGTGKTIDNVVKNKTEKIINKVGAKSAVDFTKNQANLTVKHLKNKVHKTL